MLNFIAKKTHKTVKIDYLLINTSKAVLRTACNLNQNLLYWNKYVELFDNRPIIACSTLVTL